MTLPLSTAQRAALALLTSGPRSTMEIANHCGRLDQHIEAMIADPTNAAHGIVAARGIAALISSLSQLNLIRFTNTSPGRGKGSWELTGYGRTGGAWW